MMGTAGAWIHLVKKLELMNAQRAHLNRTYEDIEAVYLRYEPYRLLPQSCHAIRIQTSNSTKWGPCSRCGYLALCDFKKEVLEKTLYSVDLSPAY